MSKRKKKMLRTELRSAHPLQSKANPLTQGYGEGKYSVHCRASSKVKGQLMVKRPNSLMAFKEGFLKATFGVRAAAHGLSSDWLLVR